ncbi:hypothetical protein KUT97_16240, partial [Pseudomonas aeruginosa]|nr:hypothetical protein [Pseudomonas aeruginosa]
SHQSSGWPWPHQFLLLRPSKNGGITEEARSIGAHGASVTGAGKPIKTDSIWSDIQAVSEDAWSSFLRINVDLNGEEAAHVMLVSTS